jgi:hypothetical protein
MKLDWRAITNSQRTRDRAIRMSSTMPSAKYSCSGSPLMLAKGSTAIEGRSGRGRRVALVSEAGPGLASDAGRAA